jgi:hypothetical protein
MCAHGTTTMLSPAAAKSLANYAEAVGLAALLFRTLAGLLGRPGTAAACGVPLQRLLPAVGLVLLALLAVFLLGWAGTQ